MPYYFFGRYFVQAVDDCTISSLIGHRRVKGKTVKRHPKVTIITPCLNSEDTIRETIESVLHQTYTNIEYIIIDGKSTDNTIHIIQEYIPLFRGRLRFISEKDSGIYEAMNKGIKLSTGSLIGIINSDDFYSNDAVENIILHMTDDKYQVIYGYCRLMNKNRIIGIVKYRHENLKDGMIPHPTCFVTRKVYQDFGLFLRSFHIVSDYEFMIRLYDSNRVVFTQIKDIIANFRTGGTSCNMKKRKIEDVWVKYHYKWISFGDFLKSIAEIYFLKDYR